MRWVLRVFKLVLHLVLLGVFLFCSIKVVVTFALHCTVHHSYYSPGSSEDLFKLSVSINILRIWSLSWNAGLQPVWVWLLQRRTTCPTYQFAQNHHSSDFHYNHHYYCHCVIITYHSAIVIIFIKLWSSFNNIVPQVLDLITLLAWLGLLLY